jgi:hypothetical protein
MSTVHRFDQKYMAALPLYLHFIEHLRPKVSGIDTFIVEQWFCNLEITEKC